MLRSIALAVALAAQGAAAQARAIVFPDTLGANFPIADSSSVDGTAADYDPLIGVWHFTFQQRRQDGTFNPPFTGHWTFRKVAGGRAYVEDHWRRDNPEQPFESGTRTYRAFNPNRKRWEVQGNATSGGQWLPGTGWSDAQHRYLVQYYGQGVIIRFRYFLIEPNRFLWRADISRDNGATWVLDWWTMEAKRVGS